MARRMPTFTGLSAAILLAALGVGVSELSRPYFLEGTPLTWLHPVAAFMGVVIGWYFTGPRLHLKKGGPVAIGITSSVAQAFLVLFTFAVVLMTERALRNSYRTVMEAVVGVFEAMMDYSDKIVHVEIIGAIVLGGAVVGLLTAWVARHTR
ncbi:MAG: TrgA family protein [Maritimibacter harenae]|uniref:TrgA family protein n=1 Tax=Maritimibacter harenae TaxID=2606218 RepID=A0A845M3P5_9RHOB|nr:TrgA family protein [Maritimibacter harenae]MZR13842.1 TrgA family protein [Maritimibacter harenae]